jgi:hypothetical protein
VKALRSASAPPGPTDQAEHGDGLVGGHDQFHARAAGLHQPVTEVRIQCAATAVDRLVAGTVDGPDQAQPLGEATAPLEWCLAPAAVVAEGGALVVVAAAEHGAAVVLDGVDAHHPEPGHGAPARSNPEGLQSCSSPCLRLGVMAQESAAGEGCALTG